MKKQILTAVATLIIGSSTLYSGMALASDEIKILSEEKYTDLLKSFKGARDCLNAKGVSSWTEISRTELILYEFTKKRPYYIKINSPAFDINFAHNIAVKTSFGNRLCSNMSDKLIIEGRDYRVKTVKKLTPEMAKQLIAYKKNKKKK